MQVPGEASGRHHEPGSGQDVQEADSPPSVAMLTSDPPSTPPPTPPANAMAIKVCINLTQSLPSVIVNQITITITTFLPSVVPFLGLPQETLPKMQGTHIEPLSF